MSTIFDKMVDQTDTIIIMKLKKIFKNMLTLEEEKIIKTFMQIYIKKTNIEEHSWQIMLLSYLAIAKSNLDNTMKERDTSIYEWLKIQGKWFKKKKNIFSWQ